MSKTQQALEWMRQNPDATAYAAAIKFGLAPSTMYRACEVERRSEHKRCPTCGQLMRK